MNTEQFIEAIKLVVAKSAAKNIESNLLEPPGRSPSKDLLDRSNWFKSLSKEDKLMALRIADEAIRVSIFGFLCVLDGVRVIDGYGEKGELKLYYEKGRERILLNDPDNESLHDIFNAQ